VDPYFAAAKAYVLPADLIFCNYALLEATTSLCGSAIESTSCGC